jgi:hypothetical protein
MTSAQVREYFAGLHSDRAGVRFASAKALCQASDSQPAKVYSHFDEVVRLLRQPNHILQWNAMRILAGLATVDRDGRIDEILEEYLAPAAGPSMIGAAEAVAGGAAIASAKPHLAALIANRILQVESAHYTTEECRNVVIGHALRACERLAPLLEDTSQVRGFAERQVENPRQATRRKAERLIASLDRAPSRVAVGRRHGVQ